MSSEDNDSHEDGKDGHAVAPAPKRHLKFLDLTNGEGGERYTDDTSANFHQHSDHDETTLSIKVDPNTPGKVVEAGQEQTGRWTKEEHDAFLKALKMYGKEWKKVAAKVKTRTVVQTRTHAQKYFQKLAKAMEQSGDDVVVTHVEMGVAPEAKKAPATTATATATSSMTCSASKKKRGTQPSVVLPTSTTKPRQSSVTSAAHLISNLSSAPTTTTSSTLLTVIPIGGDRPATSSGGGHFPAPHGFTTCDPPFRPSAYKNSTGERFIPEKTSSVAPQPSWSSMSITAPDPAAIRGKFPEPSPAACGKRKLAEIAAARMLAGVAASKPPYDDNKVNEEDEDRVPTPPPPPPPPLPICAELPPAPPLLQIVNPATLGINVVKENSKRRKNELGSPPVTPWDGQLEELMSKSKKPDDESEAGGPPDICVAPAVALANVMLDVPTPVAQHSAALGRTPLHTAVSEADAPGVERAISFDAKKVHIADDAGFFPIHTACSLCLIDRKYGQAASEILHLLLGAGADPARTDSHGNTPLHWAARSGDKAIAELLLIKNCPQDAKNNRGETALHWAMRAGRQGLAVVAVLLENGARPAVLSNEFKRPIDVAADGFVELAEAAKRVLTGQKKRLTKDEKKFLYAAMEERREVRSNLLIRSSQSRTLVLHHPECLTHTPKAASDWEVPDRVTAIMNRVLPKTDATGDTETSGIFPYEVTVSQEFDRAKLDLLSRVHSADYLAFVHELSKDLERQQKEAEDDDEDENQDGSEAGEKNKAPPRVVPFTPMVQRSIIKIEESNVKQGVHSDTSFSVGSLRAARRAAGAVQHAVDCVLVGRNRNAFCVVRPPGHHAGVNGLLDGGESCGFCIFNNVAAGAMHAISDERLLCERCAIVDIDVHHGNGTEEIVKKCQAPGKLFFFSIHLYDHEKRKRSGPNTFSYKFYPGTGGEDDVAFNIINVPIAPLWKEPANGAPPVNTHNTRQKAKQRASEAKTPDGGDGGESSEVGTPKEGNNGKASDAESDGTSAKGASSGTPPVPSMSTSPRGASPMVGRNCYRQAIQNRLLPALRAFNPDLILISTGFDAAKGDVGNARHERGGRERMGIDLEPEDYAWTTRKILEVADICCHGRVVSVLEGGYGRTPVSSKGVDTSSEPLDKTVFAECAIRHLHSLVDPYDMERRFSS